MKAIKCKYCGKWQGYTGQKSVKHIQHHCLNCDRHAQVWDRKRNWLSLNVKDNVTPEMIASLNAVNYLKSNT
jgi:hypothetical protein